MNYQQLPATIDYNTNSSYDSGYCIISQPNTAYTTHIPYSTDPYLSSVTYAPQSQLEVDTTIKQEITFAHNSAIILFGVLSCSFVSLIFLFSYFWYSIDMEYPNLMTVSIIGCVIMGVIMIVSFPFFCIMNNKYKRLYRTIFEQSNRIFL